MTRQQLALWSPKRALRSRILALRTEISRARYSLGPDLTRLMTAHGTEGTLISSGALATSQIHSEIDLETWASGQSCAEKAGFSLQGAAQGFLRHKVS